MICISLLAVGISWDAIRNLSDLCRITSDLIWICLDDLGIPWDVIWIFGRCDSHPFGAVSDAFGSVCDFFRYDMDLFGSDSDLFRCYLDPLGCVFAISLDVIWTCLHEELIWIVFGSSMILVLRPSWHRFWTFQDSVLRPS